MTKIDRYRSPNQESTFDLNSKLDKIIEQSSNTWLLAARIAIPIEVGSINLNSLNHLDIISKVEKSQSQHEQPIE